MKKILSMFLVCCVLLTSAPLESFAASGGSNGTMTLENRRVLPQSENNNSNEYNDAKEWLDSFGLLNEDGTLKTDEKIVLDNTEYSLNEIEVMLTDPGTDLSQVASVDGTPIALGDLKRIINLENEYAALEEKYFSGRTFTEEGAENMNSLLTQLSSRGMMLTASAPMQTPPADNWIVDVSNGVTCYSSTLFYFANDSVARGGDHVRVRYNIDEGLLSDYIKSIKVYIGKDLHVLNSQVVSEGILQEDGSYLIDCVFDIDEKYTYSGNCSLAIEIETTGNNSDLPANVYGNLSAAISFYDAEGMSFYNGTTYDSSYTYFYDKSVSIPSLSTSISSDSSFSYERTFSNDELSFYYGMSTTSSSQGFIFTNEFKSLNRLIEILQSSKDATSAPIKCTTQVQISQTNGAGKAKDKDMQNTSIYLIPMLAINTSEGGDKSLRNVIVNAELPNGVASNISFECSAATSPTSYQLCSCYIPCGFSFAAFSSNVPNSISKAENYTITIFDDDSPVVTGTSSTEGTYQSGMVVPIKLEFSELVVADNNATVTINGKPYSIQSLHANTVGNQLLLWYPVNNEDSKTITVSGMSGIHDVFNHSASISSWTASSVTLKSTQLSDAVTGFSGSYANGKFSFALTADQSAAFRTLYANYDNNGTDKRLAPFCIRLVKAGGYACYGDNLESLGEALVYLKDNGSEFAFEAEDISIAPKKDDVTYRAEIQYNAGTKANPEWHTISVMNKSVTVPKIIYVNNVTVNADMSETAFEFKDTKLPKLTVNLSPTNATFKGGVWSSSNENIATIDENGQISLTGQASGKVSFKYTATNDINDSNDDVMSNTIEYTVAIGDSPALVIPESASSIHTHKGQDVAILWLSNTESLVAGESSYTVELFEGNFTNAFESFPNPIYTTTATVGEKSVTIPGYYFDEVSQYINGDYSVEYTARVSVKHPDLQTERLYAFSHISVLPLPVTAKLTVPDNTYITDSDEAFTVSWKIENYTSECDANLNIMRVCGDNVKYEVADEPLSGASGSYKFKINKVADSDLRDTYQISLTVRNAGDSVSSADSFILYVYRSDAMYIQADGTKVADINLNNKNLVAGELPTSTTEILELREKLGLIEYVGINYNDYMWSSFRDSIKWESSDPDLVSVNYRQGGLYDDIRNFTYESYLPETEMALSSTQRGSAVVKAIHANTGMSAEVTVTADTLKDRFYLFQFSPAEKTVLKYTDSKGKERKVTTNAEGVLALYEPNGINSDVYLSSELGDGLYLGTIPKNTLESGERDATKLQLYPINTFTLRQAAKVELFLKKPDGTPYSGTVNVRGGVYKNDEYCSKALIGTSNGSLKAGDKDQTFTIGSDGKLNIFMDSTQFWTKSSTESLSAEDRLKYVFEISDLANDSYYPLLVSVDGNVYTRDIIRGGSAVVALESVQSGNVGKPFIASQVLSYGNFSTDVRKSTGKIGPSYTLKDTTLKTSVLLWGKSAADGYKATILDENGYIPAAQIFEDGTYPFSSIPVVYNSLTLTKATMTESGWLLPEKDTGLRLRLTQDDNMLMEKTLPFRAVDYTDVPPVDTDASAVLLEMQQGFGFNGVDISIGDDNAITKMINGNFTDAINDVQGSVCPVFRIIVTPSEDNTVFNALIWTGYNSLDMNDFDYSQDGVAVNTNILQSELELGVPGTGDIKDMAKKDFDPQKDYTERALKGKSSDVEIGAQLEGYYEGQFYFNSETRKWEFRTLGGGFTAGVGVGFEASVNAMAGPVPVTASFGAGIAIQLDFKAASVYKKDAKDTRYWTQDALKKDFVTDTLTTLRANGYVEAFGGIGFDYSVVALKIGLFGGIKLDSTNRFLSRNYLNNSSAGGKDAKKQLNGQALGASGEVGIKFSASLLFLSFEYVLASGDVTVTKKFNDYQYIDDYWASNPSENLNAASGMPAGQGNMNVASASATLMSHDYLDEYARSWGDAPKRRMTLLGSKAGAGANNANMLQYNANPLSYPEISDDGTFMAYVNDMAGTSIYESRVFVKQMGSGDDGVKIPSPSDFEGFGDSNVSLDGDSNFAVAAFIRSNFELDKNSGDEITPAEQNLLMNGTEIVASIYNGSTWQSVRLTDNSSPDLAPTVATNGKDAIVFWRSVYPSDVEHLLGFDAEDAIMYRIYTGGSWGTPQMLSNGSNGSVMGMSAAMLQNGTALLAYTLDRNSKDGKTNDYEMAYSLVDISTNNISTMFVTNDDYSDENPQVVTACFDDISDERFIIGWYSDREGGDIRLAAVDSVGGISNKFPESMSAVKNAGNVTLNGKFRFADMDYLADATNLVIVWAQTAENDEGESDHSDLYGSKLCRIDETYMFSGAQEMITLPERTLADSFDCYYDNDGTLSALIQGTWYDPVNTEEIGGVNVAKERCDLLTGSNEFRKNMLEVDLISVDYENLMLNAYTPIQFTVRNNGAYALSDICVELGNRDGKKLGKLYPNESTVITVNHLIGETLTNPDYSVKALGTNVLESGTVYLDYNDSGISDMKVINESEGKRDIRLTLFNASPAKLEGSGRKVRLSFFTDCSREIPAAVTCDMDGVTVNSDMTLTISGEALKLMDEGALCVVVTYDIEKYVKKKLKKEEIPVGGIGLYADVCVMDEVNGTEMVMPELVTSDNSNCVMLTGALARTGVISTMNVEQDNSKSNTVATVTITNNSLMPQADKGAVLATLVDNEGAVLESQIVFTDSALSCEQSVMKNVNFNEKGSLVLLKYATPDGKEGLSELSFDGYDIKLSDFEKDEKGNYVYDAGSVNVENILVSFVANDLKANVNVDNETYVGSGSKSVHVPVGSSEIEISVGKYVYKLKLNNTRPAHIYDVTFKMNGHGKHVSNQTVKEENKVIKPADPTEKGWVFGGWYKDSSLKTLFDFENMITEDTVIYAKWTKEDEAPKDPVQFIVTFEMNGHGAKVEPETVEEGKKVAKPDDPFEDGWTFEGWYKDKDFIEIFDFDAEIIEDITVYAKWTENFAVSDKEFKENSITLGKSYKLVQKDKSIKITWSKLTGADGYLIYGNTCGSTQLERIKPIKIAGGKKTSYTVKSLASKAINPKKKYKICVAAYKTVNGKDYILGETLHAHIAGSKSAYTNAKSVKVAKDKITLKKGKSTKISVTIKKEDPKKPLLGKSHGSKIRYVASNDKISVDANGKVKALKKGTSYVYVYALNGICKKVKVVVK